MSTDLYLTDLPAEALIHLRGANISGFLQGQLTCDLRPLSTDRALRGALCNVKGRVISDLWVIQVDDQHCLLRLRRSLAADFVAHLAKFARFSRIDVSLDERSHALAGLYGGGIGLVAGGSVGDCIRQASTLLLLSGREQAQMISLGGDDEAPSPGALGLADASCDPGTEAHWHARDLLEGHYAIEAHDREQYTPQALNYDERGLVSFNKGCYTGQEVVARLHYKGRSKQRLQVYRCAADRAPEVGSPVRDRNDAEVGRILRSEALGATGSPGDAVVLVAAMVAADHRAEEARGSSGCALHPLTPPSRATVGGASSA
ncbi:MAG: folate-binding protein [Halieaceae bacterium]|jgi:folate-binding protein YgfZ|nr:folate-binding protein [Halieaceae bacterium]